MAPSSDPKAPPKGGLIKRIFAYMISRNGEYESSTLRKRVLLGGLHGPVLEIGPGTGANLGYFPADVEWIGVEPNPFMIPYLERNIQNLGRSAAHYRIDPGDPSGIRLPAEDESIQAVVSTHVLCSVPHPQETLQEILRVLRPGGRFVFLEHVAAQRGTRLRWFQNKVQPLWYMLGDGCHLNRETWETIRQAGFGQVEIEHYRLESGGLVGPHIAGTALKNG